MDVGHRCFSKQRLGDARPKVLGNGDYLLAGTERARAHEHGDLLAAIKNLRGFGQGRRIWNNWRQVQAHPRMRHAVLLRRRLHGLHLQVIWQDQARHLPLGEADAIGPVDEMRHVGVTAVST